MRDRYCAVLDGHVVYPDEALPDEPHAARRAGAGVDELSDRAWALQTERPPAVAVLLGVG